MTGWQERLGAELARAPEVRLAYLFGSRARGRPRSESDCDIAVLLADEAAQDRYEAIRRVLGAVPADVPEPDIVILNDAPPLLRHRVLRDGVLLHARSEEDRVRFAVRTARDYQDSAPRRELFTRARIERLKRGLPYGRPRDLLEEARRARDLLGGAEDVPGGERGGVRGEAGGAPPG